ncbi:hypothetical protein F383_14933 [Gossypium arboreum]|uniref:Uncharacterized protein n=1 Tax=Gossypium arboreum TaxID=29729 RepID=A0A0B0PXJ0_GOSAR|nr:hypothetical protein F383_14933 [Gossypium arboreum]
MRGSRCRTPCRQESYVYMMGGAMC